MRKKDFTIAAVTLLALEGCATFTTQVESAIPTASTQDGLVYHLPLKYLILSVKVENNSENGNDNKNTESNIVKPGAVLKHPAGAKGDVKNVAEATDAKSMNGGEAASQTKTLHLKHTPNVAVSEAYPDLTTTYVLRYRRGPFSKNEMVIELNEKGLLSSAKAVATNQVSDTLKSIAAAIPSPAAAPVAETPKEECPDIGTYQKVVDIAQESETVCGFKFTWIAPATEAPVASPSDNQEATPTIFSKQPPGIYYRQVEPIVINAAWPANDQVTQFLAFVPNPHKPRFLRIPRTLFANSSAELTFVDGMPTRYAPTTESEALALVKLPADVIGAYFGAVGKVFSAFSSTDRAKANAAANDAALALQRWKTEQCLVAIKSNVATAIAAACGTSPPQ